VRYLSCTKKRKIMPSDLDKYDVLVFLLIVILCYLLVGWWGVLGASIGWTIGILLDRKY